MTARTLDAFLAQLDAPLTGEELFDYLSDIVYFVKDRNAAYVLVNRTLVKLRVHAAQELLRHSDLPIARIALDVGYSGQSVFARQFRHSTGMTPQQFRAAKREESSR